MFASPFSKEKYRLLHKTSMSQDDIPLSQLGVTTQDRGTRETYGSGKPARDLWYFLCYFLHTFLVVLHLILLAIAESGHPERHVVVPYDSGGTFTTIVSSGLQAFYTLYTALLVFITQRLVLSTAFSRPKKLTQIHDICGAWAGLGASLRALWQQTKVASSIPSIALVAGYFACVSILHVTSTTLFHVGLFNGTLTTVVPVNASWPNSSVDLASLDWTTAASLVPFIQTLYSNVTNGLANNTLYDIYDFLPPVFLNATVHTTTVHAHCGLLTNLSIDVSENSTWNVYASMPDLDTLNITVSYPPLLSEIWLSPTIQCTQPICSTFILFLVSTEMEVDDSVEGVSYVYINETYYPPDGTAQNFSSPIYFVACSLNSTNDTATLDPSGIQLGSGNQSIAATWKAFSPTGDANLTAAISSAITSGNSLPSSPYCQPVMSYPQLWANITAFNAYMRSVLGMGVSSCGGELLATYTSAPSLLTRGQVESAVSQIAAEFLWLAGELGKAGGGFDRLSETGQVLESTPLWMLNIDPLPVIFALSISAILLALMVCALWRRPPAAAAAGATVLEIMWFGSHSHVLRRHFSDVRMPSLDSLRASSMFETVFWTGTGNRGHNKLDDLSEIVPLDDTASYANSSRSLGPSGSELGKLRSNDPSQCEPLRLSSSHRWCFALHIMLVVVHVALLALLVHHPESSITTPSDSGTMTIGLSAVLQAIYTLYTTLLLLLMQRLALFKIISKRRRLTTIHDVSAAWNGIGSAVYVLWKQYNVSSSMREVVAVVAYLSMILVLHITSSSIMRWKECNVSGSALLMYLATPNSDVNIGQSLEWAEIFSIFRSVGDDPFLTSTNGLYNTTLIDVIQNPNGVNYTTPAGIDGTTLGAECGLVPNLTLSYQSSEGEYQISFQNGTNNGSFLEPPIWKDVIYAIMPSNECIDCPHTLFYLITTDINVDGSVHDPVVVELNWTYTPLAGENPETSITLAYIAACTLNTQTVSDSDSIFFPTQGGSVSWSVWLPGNATNLTIGMTTGFGKAATESFPVFFQGNSFANFTDMDGYMMSLLGLNLSSANITSASQSSANPSTTLSPWQLENAIAQTAARFLWLAGLLGESGGGFQRSLVESPATSYTTQYCLYTNTTPIVLASIASLVSLILAMFIIGKRPSGERVTSVSGTSVLECLWLEAQSDSLHSRLQTIEGPRLDKLRTAGMFDICLGDVEQSRYEEAEQPNS